LVLIYKPEENWKIRKVAASLVGYKVVRRLSPLNYEVRRDGAYRSKINTLR
jgi:hypothetical protein